MTKEEYCECGHTKSIHSLTTKFCLHPQCVTCEQDGTWNVGYCTCQKYKKRSED